MAASSGTSLSTGDLVDHLFRHQAGQMVSHLTRIFGFENLDLAEDVVQDALVQALRTWPFHGVPDNPEAWIFRVAKNRALDAFRRRGIHSEKQQFLKRTVLPVGASTPEAEATFTRELRDDQLRMMFACCHPTLTSEAQVALTLKTVGGFSVGEISRAFLSREPTVAQRLVRAKKKLRQTGIRLEIPPPEELPNRLDRVLEVLYLLFNEGYSSGAGEELVRRDLCTEAIRLACLLSEHPLTGLPKTHALAALFLFQGARFETRVDADGDLLLLRDQDRSLWNRQNIAEALRHLELAGSGTELVTYHLEAEIAACHALAASYETVDWARIFDCYDSLLRINPSPVVALNRIVALWKTAGPDEALDELEQIADHPALQTYYPAWATRGELLSQVGRFTDAAACFQTAWELSTSPPVQRLLASRQQELKARESRSH